jgi:predicted nucleotidyltransferase
LRFRGKRNVLKQTYEFVSKITDLVQDPIIYLVGSYATNSQTMGSDIDLLVFVDKNEKKNLVRNLEKVVVTQFPDLHHKIDCKILSKQEGLQSNSLNHLFLVSALQDGILLTKSHFNLKPSAQYLKDSLTEIEEQLASVQHNISIKRDFDISAFLLFAITKSLYYLETLIESQRERKKLNNILGKQYYQLARSYERFTKKGICDNVNIFLLRRGQKSGNFEILKNAIKSVHLYFKEVKQKFLQWFDDQESQEIN